MKAKYCIYFLFVNKNYCILDFIGLLLQTLLGEVRMRKLKINKQNVNL